MLILHFSEEDHQEEYKKMMMKRVAEIKEFFKNDPAGRKIAKAFHEFIDFVMIIREKAKSAIKEYAQKLVKADGKDDDDDDD
ncbi:unnamed protein product [Hymenolepis diminuta]|uniref:FH2 domain-containing protein n=1 Tax=Hymenolepis diminuta TaxID=6216 RepID=A0A0R3SNQ8_HYMDI|nr:unnamed protein product [Hymenolepis diminuta]